MISDFDLTVEFTPVVLDYKFEKTLRTYFNRSKFKKNQYIHFNFENVRWCGIFELSIISLWLIELLKKDKKINFSTPKNKDSYNFLYNYEFLNFLKNNEIRNDANKYKSTYSPFISPMFPLSFQDKTGFQDLISELSKPGRLKVLLKDIEEAEIVKNNAIHTIVLRELYDNVFIHTGCKSANMIMTKISGKSLLKSNSPEPTPFLNSSFYYEFKNKNFIYLVISDNGPGIYSTLKDSYLDDDVLSEEQKKINPDEIDIIKYSFLKHSTCRKDADRKEDLRKLLTSEKIQNIPLPTGLYQVLNIVKRYRGLIQIRSGKSIVCYNFLSGGDQPKLLTNEETNKYKKLANFPGVQYKLLFPLDTNIRLQYVNKYQQKLFSDAKYLKLKYLSINEYVGLEFSITDEEDLNKIIKIADKIKSFRVENENIDSCFVLDVSNFRRINYKNIIHYIVNTMMGEQNEHVLNVLIALSSEIIRELSSSYSGNSVKGVLPILAFDNFYNMHLIGIDKNGEKQFVEALSSEQIKLNNISLFENFPNLFKLEKNSIKFKGDKEKIVKFVKKELK